MRRGALVARQISALRVGVRAVAGADAEMCDESPVSLNFGFVVS